jgi:hypothetical protein
VAESDRQRLKHLSRTFKSCEKRLQTIREQLQAFVEFFSAANLQGLKAWCDHPDNRNHFEIVIAESQVRMREHGRLTVNLLTGSVLRQLKAKLTDAAESAA